jgi:hypothetical protein
VAEAAADDIRKREHPLFAVLNAANDVVSAIRETAEQKRPQG